MSTTEAPTPWTRKWFIIALGAVIAWSAFLWSQGPMLRGLSSEAPDLERSGLAAPAEFAWTLRDLDDQPVDFAGFRGRTIILNLWATWCPPCLEEMPSLERLATNPRIKARDVVVVCVSTDESPETLRRFVKGKDFGMTILRATSLPPAFEGGGALPSTFVIAPDGRIVAATEGAARWDDPSVVAFLENLAAPRANPPVQDAPSPKEGPG